MREEVKDRWTQPHVGVWLDVPVGQAAVKVPGVVTPGFLVHANHAVAKRQIVEGGVDLATVVQLVRQSIKHQRVVGKERVNECSRVDYAFDTEVAVMLKLL